MDDVASVEETYRKHRGVFFYRVYRRAEKERLVAAARDRRATACQGAKRESMCGRRRSGREESLGFHRASGASETAAFPPNCESTFAIRESRSTSTAAVNLTASGRQAPIPPASPGRRIISTTAE